MARSIMSYEQAIEFLFGRINYERVAAGGYSQRDFKLDRVRRFLQLIGDPQDRLPVVHVAGTKGKGSTSVMIAEMLSAAGYRVGLFTSPHISVFEERMTVGGVRPEPAELVDLVNRILEPVARLDGAAEMMSPTYFEIATALAWLYFTDKQAEIAVLEVGMGGRLDATNVCRPDVTVITTISRDHTAFLGNTLREIALEKAGILKAGVPVVSGVTNDEARRAIAEAAELQNAPLHQIGREFSYRILDPSACDLMEATHKESSWNSSRVEVTTRGGCRSTVDVPLAGAHQAANAALAIAAIDLLGDRGWKVSEDGVVRGMSAVRWPVRIEVVCHRPTVIIDAAHNWEAAQALVQTSNRRERCGPCRRLLVFSGTQDKDVEGLLRLLLPQFDTVILTQYQSNPRAVNVRELARLAEAACSFPCHVAPDPAAAWKLASRLAGDDDLVCVTGSFFIAAEMRELILDGHRPERANANGPLPAMSQLPVLRRD